jgi:hypothetical protein
MQVIDGLEKQIFDLEQENALLTKQLEITVKALKKLEKYSLFPTYAQSRSKEALKRIKELDEGLK